MHWSSEGKSDFESQDLELYLYFKLEPRKQGILFQIFVWVLESPYGATSIIQKDSINAENAWKKNTLLRRFYLSNAYDCLPHEPQKFVFGIGTFYKV